MAFIMTRVQVGDYDAWKSMFDSDSPGVRQAAKGHRIFRSTEDPNEVFIAVEFDSTKDAQAARERLVGSGVLERFPDRSGPTVTQQAEAVGY
jgi:hypothetical protein